MFKKNNVFLIGPMGAGKSTIGRQLASQLNMEFFDSDQEIETRTGANISWVFDVEGEAKFRDREEKIIDELTKKQGIVLATGGGSVKSYITRNNLSDRGLVVYLQTTIDKQLMRTQHDKRRPLLKSPSVSKNTRALLEVLAKERNPLYEEIADISISTNEQNIRSVVNKIIALRAQSGI
ncbi:shikimate kinase AroK [Blochmannia endosymbiont of Camponotus sp. C-003]|uniref:shikimate kinase AroK n=1 Tax=unclassified Candidatus Blochmanniella TaxID=711328 RepID=UPI0020245C3D|nr:MULTISPECIES: shikimate kinase AroK [unclassified Candidatus Blochmannia]URJ23613.1 shikimate kinase AroK [Blochmannia endosymbiont of Camponotus sp. C-003]URJ29059.1 shikimate kinase AroK [Blochmannia endosymbiont of Camponotus sp. C-046]